MSSLTSNRVNTQAQAGFTLIELLIVVAILGILAAVGIPQYQGYQAQARANAVKGNHSHVTQFLQEEFAKCAAGATTMIDGNTACTDVAGDIATDIVTYATAQNWANPYDATAATSMVAAADDGTIGSTFLDATDDDTLTITSNWTPTGDDDPGTLTTTVVRE